MQKISEGLYLAHRGCIRRDVYPVVTRGSGVLQIFEKFIVNDAFSPSCAVTDI